MYRIFSNFAKSCILSFLPKFDIKRKFTVPFLKYKYSKLKLRVFRQVFGNIQCDENDNNMFTNDWAVFRCRDCTHLITSGNNDTSKSWKVPETTLSHLKDVRANCFCASLLRTQIHTPRHTRACELRNNMNNDRKDSHCHSFAWIQRSWAFGDPNFSFQNQILFTIISTLSKYEQKISVGS